MENLTKHQLILVALLISFVTSIATGIVTVSLMDQAPKAVTQTINRVVERTVERVVTEPNKGGNVVKETIVVKEEDKIIEAIEKNAKSMVRIYKTDSSGSAGSLKSFIGIGVIVSKEGDIATDGAIISPSSSYSAVLNDAKEYDVKPSLSELKSVIAFLKIVPKAGEELSLTPAALADSDTLKLGQTVISLGGKLRNSVAIGVITSFIESNNSNSDSATTPESVGLSGQNESTTTIPVVANAESLIATANGSIKDFSLAKGDKEVLAAEEKTLKLIETNIIPGDNITGNPFINLSSEVVGIRVKASNNAQTIAFVPINEVKKNFSAAPAVPASSAKQEGN